MPPTKRVSEMFDCIIEDRLPEVALDAVPRARRSRTAFTDGESVAALERLLSRLDAEEDDESTDAIWRLVEACLVS
jgi:hypothetical protein